VPRMQTYYFDHDQTPSYAYARKVIQSAVTMMAYWDRIRRNDARPASLARLAEIWISRIKREPELGE
jgi:hypothetical protein